MPVQELPDVYEAILDAATEAALFVDLGCLVGLEISVKSAPNERAQNTSAYSLEQAREALHAGAVRAVQVRYVHDGKLWIDTLLRIGNQTKLVRMAQPTESASG